MVSLAISISKQFNIAGQSLFTLLITSSFSDGFLDCTSKIAKRISRAMYSLTTFKFFTSQVDLKSTL